MRKINTWYWIVTAVFAAFMLFSGINNAMVTEESIKLITTDLGYPKYFIAFIGVAKVIGAIAILIPSFRRIKEWAYAGLFFDLLAAPILCSLSRILRYPERKFCLVSYSW